MGVVEEAGKVAGGTVDALKGSPIVIALLFVNLCFLGFCGYILGEVAAMSSERNKIQMELITRLVTDIRDCRQGPKATRLWFPPSKSVVFNQP